MGHRSDAVLLHQVLRLVDVDRGEGRLLDHLRGEALAEGGELRAALAPRVGLRARARARVRVRVRVEVRVRVWVWVRIRV